MTSDIILGSVSATAVAVSAMVALGSGLDSAAPVSSLFVSSLLISSSAVGLCSSLVVVPVVVDSTGKYNTCSQCVLLSKLFSHLQFPCRFQDSLLGYLLGLLHSPLRIPARLRNGHHNAGRRDRQDRSRRSCSKHTNPSATRICSGWCLYIWQGRRAKGRRATTRFQQALGSQHQNAKSS